MTETKYAAQKKYAAAHKIKQINVPLFDTESDIINQLQKQQNVSGYIKSLIRADINK